MKLIFNKMNFYQIKFKFYYDYSFYFAIENLLLIKNFLF